MTFEELERSESSGSNENHEEETLHASGAGEAQGGAVEKAAIEKMAKPDSGPLMVAGIGASAGGLAALQRFFDALPADTGIAFVVITHLDPTRESILDELLQAHTQMPVRQVRGRVAILPDHVYVIPPNRRIVVTDSYLDLAQFDEPRGRRAPVDSFFRSLAAAQRNTAAVILSGSGTDGAVGVKAIKEQGGLLLVQDPDEAEHGGMPSAAIATGLADLVLPARELAEKLRAYMQRPVRLPLEVDQLTPIQLDTMSRILAQVQTRIGHDFSRYKHSTVLRRIQRRMQLNGVGTLEQYLEFMRPKPEEAKALFNDLLIGVTNFFRDRGAWETLAEEVVPDLFADKNPGESVRVWTIGCSTGEEAYSMGILLLEHAARLRAESTKPIQIQIFASDLDDEALARARTGLYPAVIEADISPERLQRFFVKEGDHYRVQRELRDIVLFTNHSVLRDPPFSRLDLISCRNLLIYLQRDVQENVFQIFHYSLKPGGYLFLGNSESAEAVHELFSTLDKTHRFYRALPWSEEHSYSPKLPMLPLSLQRPLGTPRHAIQTEPLHTPLHISSPTLYTVSALHRKSLEASSPPSILVDPQYAILHVSETAGRYLLQPRGPITSNLLALVRPELQTELRACLFQAFEKQISVISSPVYVQFNGHPRRVIVFARPQPLNAEQDGSEESAYVGSLPGESLQEESLQEEIMREESLREDRVGAENGAHGQTVLIFFLEDESDEPHLDADADSDADRRRQSQNEAVIKQLEAEIRRLRVRLQAVVEEHESGTEELKAANEELQSINEEYRSTTEELETSKEELQSVNEELLTVNNELKSKLEEISRAHSDLENLMTATEIATLFLDRELRINRYTPDMTRFFNLMPNDRGRPIGHLTHHLVYDQLTEDARTVLHQLTPVEREVRGLKGEWFLVRMRPYRTIDDRIDGVVLTFINVTQIKRTEHELKELNESLEQKVAERTEQVRSLVTELTMSEQAERQRISRVLHDDLQQHLYSLQFQLATLRNALALPKDEAEEGARAEVSIDVLLEQIRALEEEIEHSISITRSLSVDLSPPILHDEGLSAAIRWLASQMEKQHGLKVNVFTQNGVPRLDEDLRVMLFQMVRELLFNIIKHAGVPEAQVAVSAVEGVLTIEVRDHGKGFDVNSIDEEGHGLLQIRRRLDLVNGQLRVESSGSGTQVTLVCPVRPV